MTTISIPRSAVKKKELVAVPRDEYEAYIAWLKRIKSLRTFEPSSSEKKALKKARKNLSSGKSLSVEEIERELGITR
jgi:hypothetical protein